MAALRDTIFVGLCTGCRRVVTGRACARCTRAGWTPFAIQLGAATVLSPAVQTRSEFQVQVQWRPTFTHRAN